MTRSGINGQPSFLRSPISVSSLASIHRCSGLSSRTRAGSVFSEGGRFFRPASLSGVPRCCALAPVGAVGGQVVAGGGPQAVVNSCFQACCQGQFVGRCNRSRRAEDAIRAGTVIRVRRIVAVVALRNCAPVMVAAARVRLNAIAARTSQAALAANFPDGR